MRVSFLRPIDQFNGTHRLLEDLKSSLQSGSFDHLRISVAFAKSGPLLRLASLITEWKRQGKHIEAIFGVDLSGTSKQALEFALEFFDAVYVLHSATPSTFHPKFYLFTGDAQAVCFQGSHNLTVGGTETNLEGGVKLEFDLPQDHTTYLEALSTWQSLLPNVCPMTRQLDFALLQNLHVDNLIFDENIRTSSADVSSTIEIESRRTQTSFARIYSKPPSALPPSVFPVVTRPKAVAIRKPRAGAKLSDLRPSTATSEALVIQIAPHDNGEVFLSKIAVNQNPSFFGFPFTGKTTPKRPTNPPYPQREPDPIVNITVYDQLDTIALTKNGYGLNTVFYEKKSEIRITFPPEVRASATTDPYSIMVMHRTDQAHDYDIEIFNPGSARYLQYLTVCNQNMPSGGQPVARKMGWL